MLLISEPICGRSQKSCQAEYCENIFQLSSARLSSLLIILPSKIYLSSVDVSNSFFHFLGRNIIGRWETNLLVFVQSDCLPLYWEKRKLKVFYNIVSRLLKRDPYCWDFFIRSMKDSDGPWYMLKPQDTLIWKTLPDSVSVRKSRLSVTMLNFKYVRYKLKKSLKECQRFWTTLKDPG